MKTLIALGAASLLVLAGCGGTVLDSKSFEETLPHDLRTVVPAPIVSASCPSGVEVEKGKRFSCEITLKGGRKETAHLRLTDEKADYEFISLSPSK
jgi:Domain of unknown function (DUF4333)